MPLPPAYASPVAESLIDIDISVSRVAIPSSANRRVSKG